LGFVVFGYRRTGRYRQHPGEQQQRYLSDVNQGDSLLLVAVPGTGWLAIGGTAQFAWSASFGSSVALNGYQKLPSGLIVQWGSSQSNSAGIASFTLPITFPHALLCFNANYLLSGTALGVAAQPSSNSTTSALYANVFTTSTGAPVNGGAVYFIALGY